MKTYIYTLSDPRDNVIKYVGKTISPTRRKYEYSGKWNIDRFNNKVSNWVKKLHKLQMTPIFEIIDEIEHENWQWLERYWIEQFRQWGFNLKNQTIGGEGVCGWSWTEERRNRQAEIMREKFLNNPLRSNLGKTKELCIFSKSIIMLDKNNNIIEEFKCITTASEKYNISNTSISNCLTGRSNTAGGYKWKYKAN